MSEKRRETRWLPTSVGAMVLMAAVLFGSAYGAAASTAHRGSCFRVIPSGSLAPGTPLPSSCSAGDNGGACNQLALTAIGAARQTLEKMGGDEECRGACTAAAEPSNASANWPGGWGNPLGADYAWMYDDGLGGNNLNCRAGTSRLCWGPPG